MSQFAHARRQVALLVFAITAAPAVRHARALDPTQALEHYGLQRWQTRDGLPQDTVNAISQTRDGYVWMVTEEGIARFDGVAFTIFDRLSLPQLRSNSVRALLQDRDGNLWFGTSPGSLTRRAPGGQLTTFTSSDGLAPGTITSLINDSKGGLWVGALGGLAHFTGGRFLPATQFEGGRRVLALALAPDGTLWAGQRGGLARFRDGRWVLFTEADGLPGPTVTALAIDGSGTLWMGVEGEGGTHLVAMAKGGTFRTLGAADGLPPLVRIRALLAGRGDVLWMASDAGLSRGFAGRFTTLHPGDNRFGNRAQSLHEDGEGGLWVGTEGGGVVRLHDVGVVRHPGLGGHWITSVHEARDGTILVGTHSAGLHRLSGGEARVVDASQPLVVRSILEDSGGTVWLGTQSGLYQLRAGQPVRQHQVGPIGWIFVIHEDRGGDILIGASRGLHRVSRTGLMPALPTPGVPASLVRAFVEDEDGTRWVGTEQGLFRLAGGQSTRFSTEHGISSPGITALHRDRDGTLWLGTEGGGICRQLGQRFRCYTTRDGLPSDHVCQVIDDDRGSLWVSTGRGIFRLPRRQLKLLDQGLIPSLSAISYEDNERWSGAACGGAQASGIRARDGRLWFGTRTGLLSVSPDRLPATDPVPPVALEEVRVDHQPVVIRPVAVLPAGTRAVEFRYTAMSFTTPHRVRFRHRLGGHDDAWVEAGSRRTAQYTNLGPGAYHFEVTAAHGDGQWTERPAAFSFRLAPHFHQTVWFYGLCAVLLVGAGLSFHYLRVQQVRSRLAAVARERGRIARDLHDTLAQDVCGISAQLEAVHALVPSSPEDAARHLDRARTLASESLDRVRAVVRDLRFDDGQAADLTTVVLALAQRATAGTSLMFRVQVTGTPRILPDPIRGDLIRIVEEALSNTVRHAEARNIELEIGYPPHEVHVCIRDDGRGIHRDEATDPAAEGADHFGLTGMLERAAEIGARISVKSAPGQGTEISLTVTVD